MTTLTVQGGDTTLVVAAPAPTQLIAALDPPLVLQVAPVGATLTVTAPQAGVLLAPASQGPMGPQGPPGSAGPVATVVCAEPVAVTSPVYIDPSNGQLRVARADTYRAAFVAGLATIATPVGFAAPVSCGQVVAEDWTAATGAIGLIPGLVYFLAPEGGLTPVPPIGLPGISIVSVGRAADAHTLFVVPSNPILQ